MEATKKRTRNPILAALREESRTEERQAAKIATVLINLPELAWDIVIERAIRAAKTVKSVPPTVLVATGVTTTPPSMEAVSAGFNGAGSSPLQAVFVERTVANPEPVDVNLTKVIGMLTGAKTPRQFSQAQIAVSDDGPWSHAGRTQLEEALANAGARLGR